MKPIAPLVYRYDDDRPLIPEGVTQGRIVVTEEGVVVAHSDPVTLVSMGGEVTIVPASEGPDR